MADEYQFLANLDEDELKAVIRQARKQLEIREKEAEEEDEDEEEYEDEDEDEDEEQALIRRAKKLLRRLEETGKEEEEEEESLTKRLAKVLDRLEKEKHHKRKEPKKGQGSSAGGRAKKDLLDLLERLKKT